MRNQPLEQKVALAHVLMMSCSQAKGDRLHTACAATSAGHSNLASLLGFDINVGAAANGLEHHWIQYLEHLQA
jgi:hypothetical protein